MASVSTNSWLSRPICVFFTRILTAVLFNNKLLQPSRAIIAPFRRERTGESSDLSISAKAATPGTEDDVHSTGSM
jgi:hypothetical protein